MSKRSKSRHKVQIVGSPELEVRARQALAEARTQKALELCKQLHKQDPAPAHKDLLKQAYLERARQLRNQGHPSDAAIVLRNLVTLNDGDPAWLSKLARELAACGDARGALEIVARVPSAPEWAQVMAHAADAAVSHPGDGRQSLPESLRESFDRIMRAFSQSEAGQDEQARETLQPIGLHSPFLEWKLLLRGLLAYYQNDDARALENWQRLSADRLPARLAAPLRFMIDPAYRAAQPGESQIALRKSGDRLQAPGLLPLLRQIQTAISDEDGLDKAFDLARRAYPTLRQDAPQLVPRLATCFYRAVVEHGEPPHVERYRRVFGPPSDDPDFVRLRALVFESGEDFEGARYYWRQYEEWVETHPEKWPAGQANRVRAMIWARMGRDALAASSIKFSRVFFGDTPPLPNGPLPEECFRRSLDLAPDFRESYEALMSLYAEQGADGKAEEVARRLLAVFPDDIEALQVLGNLRANAGDHIEALGLWQRALKNNPLDRTLRSRVATGHALVARAHAEAGRFEQARAEYQACAACEEGDSVATALCKWAACEFKAGNAPRAEELIREALSKESHHLSIAHCLLIEACRFRLPKKLQSRFQQEFDELLGEPTQAGAAVALAGMMSACRLSGVEYASQKTHERKVAAYLKRARGLEFTAEQLVEICTALLAIRSMTLFRSFIAMAKKRFPNNPFFPLFEAESYFAKNDKPSQSWKVKPLLDQAAELAAALDAGERKEVILEAIRDRQEALMASDPLVAGLMERLWNAEEDEPEDDDDGADDRPGFFGFFRKRQKRRRQKR